MVKVPVVEAAAAKMTDCVAPVPEVLSIVRLLNAFAVPVIVPENVCWEELEAYTVPLPAVKVPEFV